ncbi:YcxB family protein [Pseudoalteromonas sp. SSDWG2]|uniref:YcxB family protein n=1 Tax=Pseudoalteromonas sp. SSDWG2 TaxID=3139391 RepID=UPI003BAB21A2
MLITFRIQKDEYKKFTKFALKRASGNKSEKKSFLASFAIWLLMAIVFMFIFLALGTKGFDFDIATAVVVLLPILVGVGVYFYEMLKIQKHALPKEDGFLLSESTVELKEDGLHASKDCATSFFSWKVVESISVNDGDYYLFIDNMYAIIIPNSAFKNENEAIEFKGLIKKYA